MTAPKKLPDRAAPITAVMAVNLLKAGSLPGFLSFGLAWALPTLLLYSATPGVGIGGALCGGFVLAFVLVVPVALALGLASGVAQTLRGTRRGRGA